METVLRDEKLFRFGTTDLREILIETFRCQNSHDKCFSSIPE